VNPLNLLAVANANMGQQQLHPHYGDHSVNELGVINQGQYGDTTYYMIPTAILPLLTPVEQIPVIGHALADTLDAPLRVLVEAGYDRTRSPGQRLRGIRCTPTTRSRLPSVSASRSRPDWTTDSRSSPGFARSERRGPDRTASVVPTSPTSTLRPRRQRTSRLRRRFHLCSARLHTRPLPSIPVSPMTDLAKFSQLTRPFIRRRFRTRPQKSLIPRRRPPTRASMR
jgi:PE-PPE domain